MQYPASIRTCQSQHPNCQVCILNHTIFYVLQHFLVDLQNPFKTAKRTAANDVVASCLGKLLSKARLVTGTSLLSAQLTSTPTCV